MKTKTLTPYFLSLSALALSAMLIAPAWSAPRPDFNGDWGKVDQRPAWQTKDQARLDALSGQLDATMRYFEKREAADPVFKKWADNYNPNGTFPEKGMRNIFFGSRDEKGVPHGGLWRDMGVAQKLIDGKAGFPKNPKYQQEHAKDALDNIALNYKILKQELHKAPGVGEANSR